MADCDEVRIASASSFLAAQPSYSARDAPRRKFARWRSFCCCREQHSSTERSTGTMNTNYVKAEFEKFDEDKDGFISVEEAEIASKQLGIGKHDMQKIMADLKLTGENRIPIHDFTEEIKAYCVLQLKKDPFRIMFDRLDKDGDGFIDFQEAKLAISAFGNLAKDSKVRELFNFADSNKDGLIDVEEYLQFLKKLQSKKLLYHMMSGRGNNVVGVLSSFL